MSEEKKPLYDFNYITQALGLIPVNGGKEAINPAAITNVFRDEEEPEFWIFAFYGEEQCRIHESDMPELEGQIRMKAEVMRQMMSGGLIAAPTGKGFRH